MKKIMISLILIAAALTAGAQNPNVMAELQADPMKAYGNDYPYKFQPGESTKAPKGYKAFYISLYARHGSRYYWNSTLYKTLDTLLTVAKEKNLLTAEGKAEDVINGRSGNVADLRFGHDSCIGPLTVLMGINGANLDPENPYDVKYCYQNWETSKACNIQLVFYRNKRNPDDILVKCLLNESEATLPIKTDMFPYYRWDDVFSYYTARCRSVQPVE